MSKPSAADIVDAIQLNSIELLEALLDINGADVNMNLGSALPRFEDVVVTNSSGKAVSFKDGFFASRTRTSLSSPRLGVLHLAIFCYYRYCSSADTAAVSRLDMIRFLLSCGADPEEGCNHMQFVDAPNRRSFEVHGARKTTALNLAKVFQKASQSPSEEQVKAMKQVEQMISHPMLMPKSDCVVLSNLLLSNKFSDVTFACSDGTELPAHKNILASASDYFDTYFDGPWGQQHPDGKWNTEHSSDIIKAVLTFVYSAKVPSFESETITEGLMKLAHEWNLPKLFRHAEAKRSLSISLENLPMLISEADLYEAKVLKRACVKFMKDSMIQVVTEMPEFPGTLAKDYPEIWSEVKDQLEPARKRQRRL